MNSLDGVEETSEAMYRDLLSAIATEKLGPFYNDAVNLPMAEEYNEAISLATSPVVATFEMGFDVDFSNPNSETVDFDNLLAEVSSGLLDKE